MEEGRHREKEEWGRKRGREGGSMIQFLFLLKASIYYLYILLWNRQLVTFMPCQVNVLKAEGHLKASVLDTEGHHACSQHHS